MVRERLDWHDCNMLKALVASTRSPDPNTQVGAYLCTQDNRPLAEGYNGLPRGIEPETIPWAREAEDPLDTKYPYIAHAEKNAIHNATGPTQGSKLYVTLHPCNECAIDVIQAGVVRVWYLSNPYESHWKTKAASWMFKQAGVEVHKFEWHNKTLVARELGRLIPRLK